MQCCSVLQPPEFPASLRTLAIQSPKVELADVVAVPPPSEDKLCWTRPIPLLEVRSDRQVAPVGAPMSPQLWSCSRKQPAVLEAGCGKPRSSAAAAAWRHDLFSDTDWSEPSSIASGCNATYGTLYFSAASALE